jgi:hypothetical protein
MEGPADTSVVLLGATSSLLAIGFVLWLAFSWTGYAERYAGATEGWHLGQTRLIELTIIPEDRHTLGCASDKEPGGLHCAFHAGGAPFPPESDRRRVLSPFNTVKNELFLGAGLWENAVLSGPLPPGRFSVACNYHIVGVLRSESLRWAPTGAFGPVDRSLTVGTLTDCVVPQ